MIMRSRLHSLLSRHSHHHHHHHHHAGQSVDVALTTGEEGMRAVKLSLAGLAVTAALQAVVVAISGSVALLADTIHTSPTR